MDDRYCEYCTKTFSKKSNLIIHQQTAKRCLKLQGKATGVKCEYCEKDYSPRLISKHIVNCEIKKMIEEIKELRDNEEELKRQLKSKEEDYKELAIKALSEPRTVINNSNNTTTNTTTVNNNKYEFIASYNFSVDSMKEVISTKYTQQHF